MQTRPAPPPWQVLAASFPALDAALDAREYVFPEGERDPNFQGFHRVERLIFGWGGGLAGLGGRLWMVTGCLVCVVALRAFARGHVVLPLLSLRYGLFSGGRSRAVLPPLTCRPQSLIWLCRRRPPHPAVTAMWAPPPWSTLAASSRP